MGIREDLAALREGNSKTPRSIRDDLAALRAEKTTYATEGAPVAAPVPERENNWYDAPRAALQGMTMGWSDEMGAAVAAAAAKISGDEKEYGQIYDEMVSIVRDQEKEFKDANPKTQLALELIGGVGTGIAGGGKVLAKTLANAGAKTKALAAVGIGATEGGFAGAGTNVDPNKMGDDIATGAKFGAALPMLATAGKGLAKTIAKRRIATPLQGADGTFTPINVAGEQGDFIPDMYRNVVAPSFGGRWLRQQNNTLRNTLKGNVDEAEAAVTSVKNDLTPTLERTLRKQTFDAGLPTGATAEVRDQLGGLDSYQATNLLKDQWKNNGFRMVRDNDFVIDPKQLGDDVVGRLNSSVDKPYHNEIMATINEKLADGVDEGSGLLRGENLMNARSELSQIGRRLTKNPDTALQGGAYMKASGVIDDKIKQGLGAEGAEQYGKELTAWGNYRTGRGATKNAGVRDQGEFTPEQLLGSAKVGAGNKFTEGTAPMQTPAQAAQFNIRQATDAAKAHLSDAKAEFDAAHKKLSPETPTTAQRLINTGVLSAPFIASPAAAIPLGTSLGAMLGTKTAQKTLAGQTGVQQTMADMLRKYDASPNAQQIVQGAGFGVGRQMAGAE